MYSEVYFCMHRARKGGHIFFYIRSACIKIEGPVAKIKDTKVTFIVSKEFYVKQINDKIVQHLKGNIERKHRTLF